MAEDRAKDRYRKADKSKPAPVEEKQVDPAAAEPLGASAAGPAEDATGVERKSMMDRHLMELRDMRRQHAGEYRAAFSRHEKELSEMMARHMGGGDKPTMGDKKGDKE